MKKTVRLYQCIGANFTENYSADHVGEVHTLSRWLEILFPGKDAEKFFDGYTDAEVVSYILKMCGKRLKKFDGAEN